MFGGSLHGAAALQADELPVDTFVSGGMPVNAAAGDEALSQGRADLCGTQWLVGRAESRNDVLAHCVSSLAGVVHEDGRLRTYSSSSSSATSKPP